MNKKLSKALVILSISVPMLVACTPKSTTIFATKIELSETTKSITYDPDAQEKESFTLTANITPSNYNQGTITWGGGKSYDDEYVKLTPSNDGKTCKVTANKICPDGIDVYAKIMGEKEELTATCNVKVLKKKVHATAIEFTDTTAKQMVVKDTLSVDYTVTPSTHDDLIMVTSSDPTVATAMTVTTTNKVTITAKKAGTVTLTLSCWDGETKKCESKNSLSVTVVEPTKLDYTLGGTNANPVSNLKTAANESNLFYIEPTSNITITKQAQMLIKITNSAGLVLLDNYDCTVGLMPAENNNWLFFGTQSVAIYKDNDPLVLKQNQKYYIKAYNNKQLINNSYEIRITMPAQSA